MVGAVADSVYVAVVGAGQAGLATSYWLQEHDLEHIIFDRSQTGVSWRRRWDSFCLVTPNATLRLPGMPYQGDDPDGFMPRDEIVNYLTRYRQMLDPPIREGVEVSSLESADDYRWLLTTETGEWQAQHVVVATGPHQAPSIPPGESRLDGDITQLHSDDYRRPDLLADGAVLVVGSGQSGGQIVDDLLRADREVWLAVGGAGRFPRRYRGRDTGWWLADMGFFDTPVEELPMGTAIRFMANAHVSGRDGGKDLNLRAFGRDGVHLLGRFGSFEGTTAMFADDVLDRLDGADEACRRTQRMIDEFIDRRGIEAPPPDKETITWKPETTPTHIDFTEEGISTVIWATGYHLDFSWINAPIFGDRNYPVQHQGVTALPGLYFVGLHGMYTPGSGLFWGVGRDAESVVKNMVERNDRPR